MEHLVLEAKEGRGDKVSNGKITFYPFISTLKVFTGGRKEQNGYRYKCTSNCVGKSTASNARALSNRDPLTSMIRGIGEHISEGSALQTAVVRVAQSQSNFRRDTTGLCKCAGGDGHCTGCDTRPIFQDMHRTKGDDGMDGRRGEKPTNPLFCGKDGRSGESLIIVRPLTVGGLEQQYRSVYRLELRSFDLEDENVDGIFEPGEHLFVRRIRVKNSGKYVETVNARIILNLFNSGGMPSPTRETRIEIQASEFLEPLSGQDSVAYVPSIPAGHTVTLSRSIKALIREPTFTPCSQPYKITTAAVVLKATMPGLNRRLQNFDYSRPFEIQYPLEVKEIDHLPSVSQGSENKISMQISNLSNKIMFRLDRVSPRRAEVRISMVSEVGSLLSPLGIWSPEVSQQLQEVPAKFTLDMLQQFRISHSAKDHTYTKIHVEFLISSPGPAPASGRSLGDLGIPMRVSTLR